MDYRSFQLHYECGVFLCGLPAIDQLCTDMEWIMEQSEEVSMESWGKRGRLRRIVGMVMRLFVPWM